MAMQLPQFTPKKLTLKLRSKSPRNTLNLFKQPPPIWPFLLGLFLTPWILSGVVPWVPVLPDHPLNTLTPGSLAGLSLAWLGLWIALALVVQGFSHRRRTARVDDFREEGIPSPPKVSAQQIAQVNQHWITPLGHIRAATDALAVINESALLNERLTPELIVIRAANAQLRLTIENVLDYYELSSDRLNATPRKTDIRLQIEDAVAEWQIPAQHRAGLIQYICFQDIPTLVAVDIRLLRRLLDNLFEVLLQQSGISDCAVTLLVAEHAEESGLMDPTSPTNPTTYLELMIDAKTEEPLNDLAKSLKYQGKKISDSSTEPLFMSQEITAWLIQALTKKLSATLHVGDTRPHRQGFRLSFPAPILGTPHPWQPWLKGKRCTVLTQSPIHAQAWRGHLLAFGSEIVLDPTQDTRNINCLFIDEASWHKAQTEQPAWFRPLMNNTRIIGLSRHISLRGRPLDSFSWAQITLPLFIRQRALQTLLPRIAQQNPHGNPAAIQRVRPVNLSGMNQNLPSFAGRTALVIDDDRIYQAHLVNLLTQIGITALTAAEGKTGLNSAEQADLDLILTDMHLPDILGTGIVRMLRKQERHKHTPIIAITANIQTQVHQSLLSAGADMVLTKPISLGELINATSQFLQPIHPELPADSAGSRQPKPDRVLNTLLCDELPIYYRSLSLPHNDFTALRHIAHKLRGAAACCQAKQIQTYAGQLEDSLLTSPIDEGRIAPLKHILLKAIEHTLKERECQTNEVNH